MFPKQTAVCSLLLLVFLYIISFFYLFFLLESLSCNKCSFSVFGLCVGASTESCSNSTRNVCYTGKTGDFVGFNNQGCKDDNSNCNQTIQGTLMFVNYTTTLTCCNTDKCNPTTLSSSAATAKMTVTGAVGAAILASVLGSIM
uniref:UPAR/Ly6 domain-containing protein n=1 Tax=Nothobranchius furzeri TaxID=105023 RepID=A0A8C6LQ61_NOTFU